VVRAGLACAAAALLALGGCGGTDVPAPEPRPEESIDELPKLPPGWNAHANPAGGYAYGAPRGWMVRDRGTQTEIRSFDHLVVIVLGADRTDDALAIPPAEFALRTAAATAGFEEPLEPGEPREFPHPYEAFEVSARGTNAATGVEQDVSVIAMRRDQIAVLTATVFANASPRSRASRRLAERVVSTVRGRPVSAAPR
jgi:hypothetical protein